MMNQIPDKQPMDPLISVVISTYNRSGLLVLAIRSVLNQSYANFELIIVDDASQDDTARIIESFDDQRIVSVRHNQNKGGPAARNSGIRIARGKYLAFLDDDDRWWPDKLAKQLELIESSSRDVGVVYAGAEIRDLKNNRIIQRQHPDKKGEVHQYLLVGSLFGSVSKALVKKDCFKKVGLFDESLKSCQDWDMWLRISRYYYFDYVPEILVSCYIHEGNLSFDFSSIIPGRTRMIKKHIELFKRYPNILVNHYKQIGKLHFLNGTWGEAFPWFKKAMAINSFQIFKIILWCVFEYPILKMFSRIKIYREY